MYYITKNKKIIDNKEVAIYGIQCDKVHVHDISTDKTKVEQMIALFNEYVLSPYHLCDVVTDMIA